MPPARFGPYSFLLSYDDLAAPALFFVLLHLIWIIIDTSKNARIAVVKLGLPINLLNTDILLCSIVLAVDVGIAVFSTQGGIMLPRKHESCLKSFIVIRIFLSVALYAIYAYAIAFKLSGYGWHSPQHDVVISSVWGWGPADRDWRTVMFVDMLMVLRLIIVILASCAMAAIMIPTHGHEAITKRGLDRALRLLGVSNDMMTELVNVIMNVVGTKTTSQVSPMDVVFGLLLVAAQQEQGPLAPDHHGVNARDHVGCEESAAALTSSVYRASFLEGVAKPPIPLDPATDDKDSESLREINHYVTYAIAVYGVAIDVFVNSVYEHSSVPSPLRWVSSCVRAMCCCSGSSCCRGKAELESDASHGVFGDPCGFNERAIRRQLADYADKAGVKTAELLWATWVNRGPGTSPPLAVVLDYSEKAVVVAVRGTMDLKDCIADLGACPAFFDPLSMTQEWNSRTAPFDDDQDFFVHSTMLTVARDAFATIQKTRVLEDTLGVSGRGFGWNVVCVGHSLGAGVATLLALLLRGAGKEYSSKVRCVCFEPPGGLLSKRLSAEAGRLGFLSAVCANDWISRLSLRGMQDLRERVFEELQNCTRSKWQLTMLMLAAATRHCGSLPIIRCCNGCYQAMGNALVRSVGGPLNAGCRHKGRRPMLSSGDKDLPVFNELWPPSSVVYFRPISCEWWLCGTYHVSPDWTAEWAEPEDLHEIILSLSSVELHFPNILRDAYASAAVNLGALRFDSSSSEKSSRSSSLVSE